LKPRILKLFSALSPELIFEARPLNAFLLALIYVLTGGVKKQAKNNPEMGVPAPLT
jgi:hypothetical protein